MSVQYCENCGKYIDLDKDVEHLERCGKKLKEKHSENWLDVARKQDIKNLNKIKI